MHNPGESLFSNFHPQMLGRAATPRAALVLALVIWGFCLPLGKGMVGWAGLASGGG